MVEKIFMQYICKNCSCIYLDKDVKGRMTPIKGCYCPKCVEKYGFVNPVKPPKKKLSNKQKETLEKHKFSKRKNAVKTLVNHTLGMEGDKNEY